MAYRLISLRVPVHPKQTSEKYLIISLFIITYRPQPAVNSCLAVYHSYANSFCHHIRPGQSWGDCCCSDNYYLPSCILSNPLKPGTEEETRPPTQTRGFWDTGWHTVVMSDHMGALTRVHLTGLDLWNSLHLVPGLWSPVWRQPCPRLKPLPPPRASPEPAPCICSAGQHSPGRTDFLWLLRSKLLSRTPREEGRCPTDIHTYWRE